MEMQRIKTLFKEEVKRGVFFLSFQRQIETRKPDSRDINRLALVLIIGSDVSFSFGRRTREKPKSHGFKRSAFVSSY